MYTPHPIELYILVTLLNISRNNIEKMYELKLDGIDVYVLLLSVGIISESVGCS